MTFVLPGGGVLALPRTLARLVLARPTAEDRAEILDLLMAPGVLAWSLRVDDAPRDAAERWLDRRLAGWTDEGVGIGTVRTIEDGRLVGLVGLRASTLQGAVDEPVLEIGWRVRPDVEGRGFATEAAEGWIRLAFDELGATRIACQVDQRNDRSRRLARRLGFRSPQMVELEMQQSPEGRATHERSWLRPRDLAAQLVERFEPPEGRGYTPHLEDRQRTIDLCGRDDVDVLGRDDEGHLTGSALVVDADLERVLLLFHEKLHIWVQPGGHLDGDWDVLRSAMREAHEETGIDGLVGIGRIVDISVHLIEHPSAPAHHHHDLRTVVIAPPGAQPMANEEARQFRWLTLDEIELDPAVDGGLVRLGRNGLAAAREWSGTAR